MQEGIYSLTLKTTQITKQSWIQHLVPNLLPSPTQTTTTTSFFLSSSLNQSLLLLPLNLFERKKIEFLSTQCLLVCLLFFEEERKNKEKPSNSIRK
jgi:hypothetical protein